MTLKTWLMYSKVKWEERKNGLEWEIEVDWKRSYIKIIKINKNLPAKR